MVGVQVFSFLRLPNFSSGFSDLLSLEPDWRWRETHKAASAFLRLLILSSVPSWQSFIWGRGRSVGRSTLLGLQYIVYGAELMIQSCWYRVSDGTHISMSFLSWRITPAQNNLGEGAKELSLVTVSNVPCEVVVPSPPE